MAKNNYLSNNFVKIIGKTQKSDKLKKLKKMYYKIDTVLLSRIKKPGKKNGKKQVLIIYNLALGDGVIFRCSTLNLRTIFPKKDYEITIICQKGLNKIYDNDEVFDRVIPIDYNKSTVSLSERKKSFKVVRDRYYDIIIDPVGISEYTTNIFFTRAAVGDKKIGLIDLNINNYCNTKFINKIYDEIIYLKKKNLSLIEYYSYFFNQINNKFPKDVGLERLKLEPNKLKLPKKYLVVFPSASMKLKRWPIDSYVELTERIIKKTKLKLVIVGTNADKESIDEFKSKLKIDYVDLFGKTTLNDYLDILSKASLVVTNDTSAYHIAMVQDVPVAIITGGYTYYRYVEYNFKRKDEFIRPCMIVHKMKCFDCYNRCPNLTKDNYNWPCLQEITVDDAWKKIEEYIKEHRIGG